MAKRTDNAIDLLREFTKGIREKKALDGVGESSFPDKEVDDGTQDVSEGARSAENTEAVKESVPGESVDEADPLPATEIIQDDLQPNKGVTQSSTGEDPSLEDDYKDKPDEPGTDHPAKADEGEKYASWSLDKLRAEHTKVANAILADIAAEAKTPAKTKQAANAKAAAAAGYNTAANAGKPASAQNPIVLDTVKEANHMADLTFTYLSKYAEYCKQAEGEEGPPPEDADGDGRPDAPPADDVPPEAPPEAPGDAPADPAGAPPAPEGDPIEGLLQGAEGGQGAPIDAAPPTHDENMQGMSGAMDDMQLTPELIAQLIQLLQSQGMPKSASALTKAAKSVRSYRLSGSYVQGPPKTARQKKLRNEFRGYLAEVVKPVLGNL